MADNLRYTFRKPEHLCSKKRIEALFSGGHALSAYPIRAIYISRDEKCPEPVQVLISVSKRHFRHAVDRNRLKRLIREAYRLNKHMFLSALCDRQLDMAFIWMSNEKGDFRTVENRIKNLLQRIVENEREKGERE